jgi:cell division protein FtsB
MQNMRDGKHLNSIENNSVIVKWIFCCLFGLFIAMQYEIWLAPHSGILYLNKMVEAKQAQQAINKQKQKQNELLINSINDLKHGHTALEEQARYNLGMIKPGEVLYQVINE